MIILPLKTSRRYDLTKPVHEWMDVNVNSFNVNVDGFAAAHSSEHQHHNDNNQYYRADVLHLASLRNVISDAIYSSSCHEKLLLSAEQQGGGGDGGIIITIPSIVKDLKEYHAALLQLEERSKNNNNAAAATQPQLEVLEGVWSRNLFAGTMSSNNSNASGENNNAANVNSLGLTGLGLTYERYCILWNLASIESYLGQREILRSNMNIETTVGTTCTTSSLSSSSSSNNNKEAKTASIQHSTKANKHYSTAAGLIQHLHLASNTNTIHNDSDFSRSTLFNLQQLLLVQGQSCAFDIASRRTPDMHSVLGKLCFGAHDQGYSKIQVSAHDRNHNNAAAHAFVQSQTLAWKARAEYHKARECWASRKYGAALCRFRAARSDLQQALQIIANNNNMSRSSASDSFFEISSSTEREWQLLLCTLEEQLEELSGDNETIYKQDIPSYSQLPDTLKALCMAKPVPPTLWIADTSLCRPLFISMIDASNDPAANNNNNPNNSHQKAAADGEDAAAPPQRKSPPQVQDCNQHRFRKLPPERIPEDFLSPIRAAPQPQSFSSSSAPRIPAAAAADAKSNATTTHHQNDNNNNNNNVPMKAMKRFSKEVMNVFDTCEKAATEGDLAKTRAWLDRHPSSEMAERLGLFRQEQTKMQQRLEHEQEQEQSSSSEADMDSLRDNPTNTNNSNDSSGSGSLLPLSTWRKIQTMQDQSMLHELSMRLWQLRDASEDARTFCKQIDSTLQENVEMDRLFREEHHGSSYNGQDAAEAQQHSQAEYDHYLRLLEDAQQGDTTLLQVLDRMETQSKYKLLRMSRHDIEHLVAPSRRDQERLKETLLREEEEQEQRRRHANNNNAKTQQIRQQQQKHNFKKDPNTHNLINMALRLDVRSLQEHHEALSKGMAVQEELLASLHVFGQDTYLHALQDRLKDCAAPAAHKASTSTTVVTVHVHDLVEEECQSLHSLQTRVCQSFQDQSQRFRDVQQEYKLFVKAEQTLQQQALLLVASSQQQQEEEVDDGKDGTGTTGRSYTHKDPQILIGGGLIHNNKTTTTKDPAMMRYNNIVQSIDEAVEELAEKMDQVKDGEHFYKNIIPRLQELLKTIQDLSTNLAIERCEYEETTMAMAMASGHMGGSRRRRQDSAEIESQMQKDHEAAAQLARDLDEADRRRQEEDARMASELARSLSIGDQGGEDRGGGNGGGNRRSFRNTNTNNAMMDREHQSRSQQQHPQPHRPPDMVDAPSLLTTCSTLGDPLLQAAALDGNNTNSNTNNNNNTAAFLNANPQYGTRPTYMLHNDRLISDVTMPTVFHNNSNSNSNSNINHPHPHSLTGDGNNNNNVVNHNQHANTNSANANMNMARSTNNSYHLDTIMSDDRHIAEAAAMAEASNAEQQQQQQRQQQQIMRQSHSQSEAQSQSYQSSQQRNVSFAGSSLRSGSISGSVPGVYQMSNFDLPVVRVDDALVADLVGMGFEASKAHEALQRHENNMEYALNELLLSS
jgi:hypothetical protein